MLKRITLEKCIVRMLIAWSLVITFMLMSKQQKYYSLDYFKGVNFVAVVLIVLGIFLALTFILYRAKNMKIEKILLFSVVFIHFFITLRGRADIYFYTGVMVLMGILIYYCFSDSDDEHKISAFTAKTSYIILALIFILFVGGLTALRYLSYRAPGFDFGIFAQMFNSMKTNLLPNTTIELDKLSSHFAVHISPIYYLLLPVYAVFPHPVTLQISQSVILASGFIPLYLLCKKFNLSNFIIIAIGTCYAFYPALVGGCFYDIHENAFLTPLILWMFYFIEKEKFWGILVCLILIFMVKEDAPVYAAFIALYMIVGKKQYKKGSVVLILSILYFAFVLWLLKTYGEGAKFDRYNNYVFDDSGIIGVIKAVIINPAYVLSQSITQEKFVFMLQVLVPLGFLPLMNKNYAKFILVGPFIIVNLMSNYPYQHSIEYQYNFGVTGIFFYLVISNLEDIKPKMQKMFAVFCMTAAVFLFSWTMVDRLSYINDYQTLKERIHSIDYCIDMVPDNASVAASPFIAAHLYDHKVLYGLPTKNKPEYIIVDLGVITDGISALDYKNTEFEELYYDEGIVALYRRN